MAELPRFEDLVPVEEEQQETQEQGLPDVSQLVAVPADEQPLPDISELQPTVEDKEASWWDKVRFGFESTASDVENLGLILESKYPVAYDVYESARETAFPYLGEAGNVPEEEKDRYYAMPEEERRQFLQDQKNAQLKEQFPELYEAGESSGWELAGSVGGALSSPTTMLPFGPTFKAAVGVGAALGLQYDVLDQYAKTGQVDVTQAATATAVGAGGGAIAGGVTKGLDVLRARSFNKQQIKQANETMQDVEVAMNKAVADGVRGGDFPVYIQKATGKTQEEIAQASLIGGHAPRMPTKDEAVAAVQIFNDNMLDPTLRSSNSFVDQLLGVLSTRLGMINKPMKLKVRKLDMDTHIKTHEGLKEHSAFRKSVGKLPKAEREKVNVMLSNGDYDDVLTIMNKYDKDAAAKLGQVRAHFDKQLKGLKDAGYKGIKEIANYFPRVVKDQKGLQKYLGQTAQGRRSRNVINVALKKRKEQLKVSELPREEIERITNNVLRGYAPKIDNNGLSFAQDRTLPRLTSETMKFYADPMDALTTYTRQTVNNIEKRKFFGQSAKDVGEDSINVEDSIEDYISDQLMDLDEVDLDVMRSLLNARFINGERGAHTVVQMARNLGYLTTLANPLSAATQFADLSIAIGRNGLRNTLRAVVAGDKRVNLEDFGLEDVIAEEFANEAVLARTLHKFFTVSGFRAVDRFGKNTLMRGSWNKAQKMARSESGIAKLRDKYGDEFGAEFNTLVDDLKAGKITENTKLYLWSELANVQPISLSEMPQKYLEVPNGRLWYALKTFAIKQIDILRREVKQEWDKGNKKEAIRNGALYLTLVPTANMGIDQAKNVVLGREPIDEDEVPEEWLWSLLSIFGGSEYVNDRYLTRGDPVGAVYNTIQPPVDYLNSAYKAGNGVLQAAITGDTEALEEGINDVIREAPLFGRFIHNYFGGGLEEWEDRQD